MIESTLGGITFSTGSPTTFTLRTLDGWYSGPPVRSEVEDRPNSDGAFGVTRVYKGARVITQTGLILAATTDEAIVDPWIAFAGLQADGLPSQFEVTDASGPKTVEVTLAGPPEVGPLVNGAAEYVLQLIARDPVKYGPLVTQATGLPVEGGGLEYELFEGGSGGALYYGSVGALGRITLINTGTMETWPSFEVSGQLDGGFVIQRLDSGATLRYERVVPAGTTVTINSRTGEVLVDGQSDASTYLTRDEFFSIPPGSETVVQFSSISTSSGTPTMTVMSRSGW